jgi:hypothetical protein
MRVTPFSSLLPWLIVPALLAGCGDDSGPAGPQDSGFDAHQAPIEPVYAEIERMFNRSCVFSACHGGSASGVGAMNFQPLLDAERPLTEALVDVPACQYHLMPRVDPGNPDNSWLWIKLDPERMDPSTGEIVFEPDPSFDGSEPNPHHDSPNCPLGPDDFGHNMPYAPGSPSPMRANELEAVRQWIELGAPGPDVEVDAGVDAGADDAGVDDAGADDAGVVDASTDV